MGRKTDQGDCQAAGLSKREIQEMIRKCVQVELSRIFGELRSRLHDPSGERKVKRTFTLPAHLSRELNKLRGPASQHVSAALALYLVTRTEID